MIMAVDSRNAKGFKIIIIIKKCISNINTFSLLHGYTA